MGYLEEHIAVTQSCGPEFRDHAFQRYETSHSLGSGLTNHVLGNRFRELPRYHSLIRAHGVIAAITFLFIVPASILVSRFYRRRNAVRIHIWLNILTVLLVIVIFTLGNVAVGPSRALSNPHHGIGTAIFVLVLVIFIHGTYEAHASYPV